MLSRWQKLNIVHGFLNTMPDDIRLEWHHTIEQTYENLIVGHYGKITCSNGSYTLYKKDGSTYKWRV